MKAILSVKNLKKYFGVNGGLLNRRVAWLKAVDGISFDVMPGEILGVVGESGCGKSTVGRTLLQLERPTSGQIEFDGHELSSLSEKDLKPLRKNLQMIFQDPFESLNPRHSVGQVLEESFIIHTDLTSKERADQVDSLLERVGLPASYRHRYPHEFSGGQRQRVGIARAISQNPKLIVCDEPVSALDVSIQAQIINLMLDLQEQLKLSYVFIAHDLAVVKHVSDRIAVMYLGKIVEMAESRELYENPLHPYTQALISSIPNSGSGRDRIVLKGEVPSPINPPTGCNFRTRCPLAQEKCAQENPQLKEVSSGHKLACHFKG